MIRDDPDLLHELGRPGPCEWCGRKCLRRDPHHAFKKRGMGGGSRLDLPEQIASLCRMCHVKCDKKEFNDQVKAMIADREGTTVEVIEAWLDLWLMTPKEKEEPARTW